MTVTTSRIESSVDAEQAQVATASVEPTLIPEALPHEEAPAAEEARPNYMAIYASSILAVTMLFLVGVGLPVSMYLDNFAHGFGLGAFCAVWGGPSFGVMAGAARVSAWFEAHGEH